MAMTSVSRRVLRASTIASSSSASILPQWGFCSTSLPPPKLLSSVCQGLRNFSTDDHMKGKEPFSDPFLQSPTQGLIYGRLTGIGKNTLKTDVIHFFEGCGLTPQDIKVDYARTYALLGMILQFSSRSAFEMAARLIARKGRLYRLEKVDRRQWDPLTSYDGKTVLLQGVPRNAIPEDVERFLTGCNFDASSIRIVLRPGFPNPIRLALVRFPSHIEAMNAFRTKNRSFCLNSSISMCLLQ